MSKYNMFTCLVVQPLLLERPRSLPCTLGCTGSEGRSDICSKQLLLVLKELPCIHYNFFQAGCSNACMRMNVCKIQWSNSSCTLYNVCVNNVCAIAYECLRICLAGAFTTCRGAEDQGPWSHTFC